MRTLTVKGKDQCRFWVRAFKLEEEVEQVRQMMDNPGPRKFAAAPIVTEFDVDHDLKFYSFMVLKIDPLGIVSGDGVIWVAKEAAERKEALEARDKLADEVLENMNKERKFDEVIEVEDKKE